MQDYFNYSDYFRSAVGYPNYPETYPIYTNTQYINRCVDAETIETKVVEDTNTQVVKEEPTLEEISLSRAVPKEILDMIRDSVGDEKTDEAFYELILSQAPTEDDKNIIRDIQNDERKHNRLLRSLYKELTGVTLPEATATEPMDMSKSYLQNLEKALMGELEAAKKYRKIMGEMPTDASYNVLMEIMVDELRHGNKYNYLITKEMNR